MVLPPPVGKASSERNTRGIVSMLSVLSLASGSGV